MGTQLAAPVCLPGAAGREGFRARVTPYHIHLKSPLVLLVAPRKGRYIGVFHARPTW